MQYSFPGYTFIFKHQNVNIYLNMTEVKSTDYQKPSQFLHLFKMIDSLIIACESGKTNIV